jgi:hypothetical protein
MPLVKTFIIELYHSEKMPREPHLRHGEWQGGHLSRGLKNQYRILNGGRVAEVRAAGGKTFFIDVDSVEKIRGITWCFTGKGYVMTKQKKSVDPRLQPWSHLKGVSLARYLLNYTGPLEVDHKDRIQKNNCLSNLRILTKRENQLNRKLSSNNKSGLNAISEKAARYYWRLTWYVNGRQREESWMRDPDVDEVPQEVKDKIAELRAAGVVGKLNPLKKYEKKQWVFSWYDTVGRRKHELFDFTPAGHADAKDFKVIKDREIGNRNGR